MNASAPPISVSELDMKRLERLLEQCPRNAAIGLEEELARANVVPSTDLPPTTVSMNSTVEFFVDDPSQTFSLTLVYPKDAAATENSISILSPVGSALLGLAEGDRISWPRPGGGQIDVTIKKVLYQPERAGELHR
ncbi:MAG: nucleoside diphosphate kinase regulator [Wenzhouxiangella sp.]